jgi:hypothetical protein
VITIIDYWWTPLDRNNLCEGNSVSKYNITSHSLSANLMLSLVNDSHNVPSVQLIDDRVSLLSQYSVRISSSLFT